MTSCPAYSKSCPEPVSTVNVNITQVQLSDGNIDLFKQEALTLTLISGNTYEATLGQLPYTDESLQIFLNGVLLKSGVHYTRNLKTITFTMGLDFDITSNVTAIYIGTEYARLESAIQPGMIIGAGTASSYNFIGFIPCDGAEYLISAYPALYDAIGTSYNDGSEAAGHFRVPNIENAYVDSSSNFNTGPAWIKV